MKGETMAEDELVPYGDGEVIGPPPFADDSLIGIADRLERRVDAYNKIKRVLIKLTGPRDWMNQGGNPDLSGSGAEKIARMLGVSWDKPVVLTEREPDGHFTVLLETRFAFESASIWALGSCSSRKPVHSKGKGGVDIPPAEIDIGNVRKHALTNCIKNGIGKLFGLRNLTWDDLKEAGITPENCQRIEYEQEEMAAEKVEKRTAIGHMLFEMSNGDPDKAKDALQLYSSFVNQAGEQVPGKRDLERLTPRQIPKVHEKVEAAYLAWKNERAAS